jgi:hypothetical protein
MVVGGRGVVGAEVGGSTVDVVATPSLIALVQKSQVWVAIQFVPLGEPTWSPP